MDLHNICTYNENSGDIFNMADHTYACSVASTLIGEPLSVKCQEQFLQISISNRFQEYIAGYNASNMVSELVKPGLGAINKVPIQMVVAPNDFVCPAA